MSIPQPPYAVLMARVNSGAWQKGGVTLSVNDGIDFRPENTNGIETQLFEIYDYPDGCPQPAGWSTDADGVYYYSTGLVPPQIITTRWGKFMFRLTLNAGLRNGVADSTLVDELTAAVVAPVIGFTDIGDGESIQFEHSWIQSEQDNLRVIENLLRANE